MEAIIVSGMPAVGKTTLARTIGETFGFRLLSGGDALKELAIERGYRLSGSDWWDTDEGMRFLAERKSNPDFDHLIDQKLIAAAESGGTVITSYTLPWIWQKGIKFWLEADIKVRAGRLAKRDSIPIVSATKIVEQRDIENRGLYAGLYGMALGEDLRVFDHVINTERIGNKEVAEEAIAILRNKL